MPYGTPEEKREWHRQYNRRNYPRRLQRNREALAHRIATGTLRAEKRCGKCGQLKFLEAFPIDLSQADGRRYNCTECRKKTGRKSEKTPQARKSKHLYDLKYKFGLSPEEFERMVAKQNGVCSICKKPDNNPRTKRLAVDHNHTTGRVRELLCTKCNMVVGILESDPNRLEQTRLYLERHKE